MYKKIILKKNEERRLLAGHSWIFSNEINGDIKEFTKGELVSVFSSRENPLGTGFINPHSLIAVRMLSRNVNQSIDECFIETKFDDAMKFRKSVFPERDSFRLIYGESDGLPGLIIDKYNNSFVLQVFSAGFELMIDLIKKILIEKYNAENIILRNDFAARDLEGLPKYKEQVFGNNSTEIIDDGIIKTKVNLLSGQKTGSFFDQVKNRHSIINYCKDKRVLDCFCNDGGFSLAALYGKAKHVTSVDNSNEVLNNYKDNINLNNFDKANINVICEDAFTFLKNEVAKGNKYDLIILDPPSFTKSKKNIKEALHGYFSIHNYAFKVLNKPGFLATASCSHHISESDFFENINMAGAKNNCQIKMISKSFSAPDHPVLLSMPETNYLKFALLYVGDMK